MMNASAPLVSVFMPCFNQELFVAQAIESALSQTYPNIEIIVGDDCSADRTWDIVLEYAARHPEKVKPFRNERNLGITRNCNAILRRCSGKYIAFHAGDDVLLPDKIRRQVEAMEQAGAILSYHDIEVFDSQTGSRLRNWNTGPGATAPVTGDCRKVARHLIENGTGFMAALSVMALRSALPVAGYDERIRIASDWFMWIEVCVRNNGPVIYLPDIMARYRRHAGNVTGSENYFDDELIVLALVEHRNPELIGSLDRARVRLRYAEALYFLRLRQEKLGRKYLLRSLFRFDCAFKAVVRWVASLVGLTAILQEQRSPSTTKAQASNGPHA